MKMNYPASGHKTSTANSYNMSVILSNSVIQTQ